MRNTQHRTWNMTRKTEKREKWEMQTVGPEYGEKLGKGYRNTVWHEIWPETNKQKKHVKWEMHTVGPGVFWANWKSRKMRNIHFIKWIMARNTEKREK